MMIHDPTDIFNEMDEMFDRLFNGAERWKGSVTDPRNRYRGEIRGSDEGDRAGEGTGRGIRTLSGPHAEVQILGNEVKIVADLPGVSLDSLRLGVRDGRLVIDAGDANYHYHTSVALPPVDAASLQYTLKNGILDVTFTAKDCSRQSADTGRS